MKRKTTEEERALFQQHVAEALLKPATPKPRKKAMKPGRVQPPPHARSALEGEVAVAALAMRRPEGDKEVLDGSTARKLRRGRVVPGRRIDLHGMTEGTAHRALHGFLARAQADGVRLVLVITGIGNPNSHQGAQWARPSHGALKEMTPRWLSERDFSVLISGWTPAHKRHGGEGALYVYLRRNK